MTKSKLGGVVFLPAIFLAFILYSLFFILSARAFTGPAQTAGTGAGAIGVDAANNLSIGTSTTQADTKLIVVASSTAANAYSLRITQPGLAPILIVRNDGRIGVATNSPAYALDVVGDVRASGALFGTIGGTIPAEKIITGVFTSNGTLAPFSFGSSLGIATSSQVGLPQPLSVYGNTYVSGNIGVAETSPGSRLTVRDGGYAGADSSLLNIKADDDAAYALNFRQDAAAQDWGIFVDNDDSFNVYDRTDSRSVLVLDGIGNVGIGTTAPAGRLHVRIGSYNVLVATSTGASGWGVGIGTIAPQRPLHVLSDSAGVPMRLSDVGAPSTRYAELVIGSVQSGWDVYGDIPFYIGTVSSTPLYLRTGGNSRLTVDGVGNVGIGTTAPDSKLHVVGAICAEASDTGCAPTSGYVRGTQLCIGTDCRSAWPSGGGGGGADSDWLISGSNMYATTSVTNVGIGVTGPSSKLHISGPATTQVPAVYFTNTDIPKTIGIGFVGGGTGINIYDASVGVTRLSVDTAGNVGIATTTPAYKLDVVGDIRASGSLMGNFAGTVNASSVTSGVFAPGNFAFRSSLGIATSSQVSLPQALSVYGGGYFSGNVGIGVAIPGQRLELGTGNFALPATTATDGAIYLGGVRFVHGFGPQNVFVGRSAGNFSMTGSDNVGVGDAVLAANTSGFQNMAVGRAALLSNTSGNVNAAIGYNALRNNIVGSSNTAVGGSSLTANTASENTAVGYYSLGANTSGSGNVGIGRFAGAANTIGANNTFIGYNAGFTGTSVDLTNAAAIGYNAQVTQSNSMVLGNGANVAIGLTAPTYKLDVWGDVNVTSTSVYRRGGVAGISVSCPSGQALATTTVSGGIITGGSCTTLGSGGITSLNGLSEPSQVFSTTTNAGAGINIVSSGNTHTFSLSSNLAQIGGFSKTKGNLITADGVNWQAFAVGANGRVLTASSTAANGVSWEPVSGGGGGGVDSDWLISGSNMYATTSVTNVGIGVTGPSSKLHISGPATTQVPAVYFTNTDIPKTIGIGFVGGGTGINIYDASVGVTRLSVDTAGNVGIATTTPAYKLDVVGDIRASGSLMGNFAGTVNASSVTSGVFAPGNFAFRSSLGVNTSTNVGLPGELSVYGEVLAGAGSAALPAYSFINSNNTGIYNTGFGNNTIGFSTGGTQRLALSSVLNAYVLVLGQDGSAIAPAYSFNNDTNVGMYRGGVDILRFVTAGADRITVDASGNVGIATTSPAYKLDVAGSGRFTGDVTLGDGVGSKDLIVGGGVGMIDAGGIDPVYTIDGKQYATYGLSMTGLKEETTGLAKLAQMADGRWQMAIDFNKAEEGSDLWLFAKAANLRENFDKLVALITPAFDGRVWYEKDAVAMTLTVFAEIPNSKFVYSAEADASAAKAGQIPNSGLEVSYRLTAPRFDYLKWTNVADGTSQGFDLDGFYGNR